MAARSGLVCRALRGVPVLIVLFALAIAAPRAAAADRYALVVAGAAGDTKYVERYDDWRGRLVTVLADGFGFGRDRVVSLGPAAKGPVRVASRENVRAALSAIAGRMHAHDLLLVVLVGHGTFDGKDAKFNLVGPDLAAGEWAALAGTVPGRLVVVDTTGASFPFLAALSAKGRVVITATDSPAARYDTVFPEYFVKALEQATADIGSGAPISIWQIFTTASSSVRGYYEQRGLLPVEHAMLDDAGDRYGKDADQPGTDSSFAEHVYLTADPSEQQTDPATRALTERRDDLLAQIEKLKAKKASLPADQYDAQLEKLLVDLARVSRDLRGRKD